MILQYQAVNINRVSAKTYTVNNINGQKIIFRRLLDAKNFVNANWGQALIEAQFTN